MRTDINVWTDDQPLKALHDAGDGFLWITTADASVPRAISIFGNPVYLSRLAAAINGAAEEQPLALNHKGQPLADQFHDEATGRVDLDDEIPF